MRSRRTGQASGRPLKRGVRHRVAMKPSQAFGVVVRVVGLLACLVSLFYVVSVIVVLVDPHYRPSLSPSWHYLIAGAIWLFIGWLLLRKADRVVAFAYRHRNSDAPDA
jgi:hypothetical protein